MDLYCKIRCHSAAPQEISSCPSNPFSRPVPVSPSSFFVVPLCWPSVAGCHRSPAPDVVATVNGKDILSSDLEKYYKASLGDNPQQPSPEQADIRRLNILDR